MNRFLSASVMTGAMALAILAGAGPAEAARTQCQIKYSGCNERCAARYRDYEQILPCIQRTCDRQYDNCERAAGGGKGGKGGRGGFVASNQQRGPVGVSPRPAGRPGASGPFMPGDGMKPKGNGGGIFGGPIRMSSQGRR